MLNRDGGDILLGVGDNGNALGVDDNAVSKMVTDLVSLSNNPHGEGPIDPANFVPFPKNPLIAKFFIQLGRVEELGSGILTTTRLMKEYADKGKAVFIEGGTFKTIIPVPERKTIGIDDTANDTVKKRLVRIILLLHRKPGLRINELAEKLNVSEVTIKRDMQKVRPLVEYRGSQKTGGYFLTDYMLSKLNKK
jgi:ATP-dependent DNA helicase RecG